ncbi:carboxypeptidase regulatory-like domain-containing protein [Nodosilinea sp. LEGE 06152]|uniref:carboxypeptidase-like regulatory domain-containing protein n=1 Tax=Nodosilinea sp. LEGE 06152 TaxID=2777966 RepID=UPI0018811EBE|nr:carboxypeptidase-like regulatory domain-containing protein [Nodosilinea sp. LEGE 06152]MBE9156320.1 carboxypeptidase regulatory-like domain-containing protein [Nodosilinea sp. LEGE 06152]
MSTQKASKALLSKLAETVIKEFRRDDLYVAQVPLGVVLGKEHFQVLQKLAADRLDQPESVARLVEISRLVDCIQINSETVVSPDDSPGFLSERFPQILANVQFVRPPLGEAEQRRYDQAQALLYEEPQIIKRPDYQEFCLLRADLEKKEVALMAMRLNHQRAQSIQEQTVLAGELSALESLVKEQREALEAIDRVHNFRSAEGIIDAAERDIDSIPLAVRDMVAAIPLMRIADPISHATHVGCHFSPSHLSEDNWIPLKLTREDIAQWQSNGTSSPGGAAGLDDSEIESITLEVQTVTCSRPWLWPALFEHQNWKWRNPSRPVSDGVLNGNTEKLIPGYVFGLVLARNVVVKGVPTSQKHFAQAQAATAKVATVQAATVDSSDLLTYAITPNEILAAQVMQVNSLQVNSALLEHKTTSAYNLRVKSAVASGQVAPLISSHSIQPALAQASQFKVAKAIQSSPSQMDLSKNAQLQVADAAKLRPVDIQPTGQLNSKLFPQQFRHRIDLLQREALMMPARGQVVDPQGRGLYQAMVTIQTPHGTRFVHTGQNGDFTARLPQGRYAVKVDKPGFITASGFVTVPQTTNPPVITMVPEATGQLKICLLEQVAGKTYPFTGAAKVMIEGKHSQQVEVLNNRSETIVSLSPGRYQIMLSSETAEKIIPATQTVEIASQANSSETRVEFTLYPAPQISNPEVQLLGFICKRVPACPTK